MTANGEREMSDEKPTELKTTDVDAAKRFIVKNDPKGRYVLPTHFGSWTDTVSAFLRFPTRKSFFEALDEIDGSNRCDSFWYDHLPTNRRIEMDTFIHESNLRPFIITYTVDANWCGGVYVRVKVDSNTVWDAMVDGWQAQRKRKAERVAAKAADPQAAANQADEEEE